jgi:hypothetical protein
VERVQYRANSGFHLTETLPERPAVLVWFPGSLSQDEAVPGESRHHGFAGRSLGTRTEVVFYASGENMDCIAVTWRGGEEGSVAFHKIG